METKEIRNVHILNAGKWNGLDVTEKDLSEIVENFYKGIVSPVLNINHDNAITDTTKSALGTQSLGIVSSLVQKGKELYADFKEVPSLIADYITSGIIPKVSAEFFSKRKPLRTANGETVNLLRAVSFFGDGVPAVSGLKRTAEAFKNDCPYEVVELYKKEKEGKTMPMIEIEQAEHQRLLKIEAQVSANVEAFKSTQVEVEKLKAEAVELKKKADESDKAKAELEKFKAESDKKEADALNAEAEAFTAKLVEEGKLMPKDKAYEVDEYKAKKADAEKFKVYSERWKNALKVVPVGNEILTTDATGKSGVYRIDAETFKNTDRFGELVEEIQTREGLDFAKATEKAHGMRSLVKEA